MLWAWVEDNLAADLRRFTQMVFSYQRRSAEICGLILVLLLAFVGAADERWSAGVEVLRLRVD